MSSSWLDPKTPDDIVQWQEAIKRLVDGLLDRSASLSKQKPWNQLHPNFVQRLRNQPDRAPLDALQLVEHLLQIISLPPGLQHPRFFGWVMGAGQLAGMLGAWSSSIMNTNAFGGSQAITIVEQEVLHWTRDVVGISDHQSAVLTSGCSEANLLALLRARTQAEQQGLDSCIIMSKNSHHSIEKAARILKIPIRWIASSAQYVFDYRLDLLKENLEVAKQQKQFPIVVATAGTAGLGIFEPLTDIHDLAKRYQGWLHVDAAYGAWTRWADELAQRSEGLHEADSVALDYHKALHAPYAVGACLSKHDLRVSFGGISADYFAPFPGGLAAVADWPGERSICTSRPGFALGVWATILGHSTEILKKVIKDSYEKAEKFAEWLRKKNAVEVVSPAVGHLCGPVVVFRFAKPDSLSNKQHNRLHIRIVTELQHHGEAVLGPILFNDYIYLRVSTINHRSQMHDFYYLYECCERWKQTLTS